MTARELINELLNLDLDKEVYICTYKPSKTHGEPIAYTKKGKIYLSKYKIKDIGVNGLFENSNCIIIGKDIV